MKKKKKYWINLIAAIWPMKNQPTIRLNRYFILQLFHSSSKLAN